jgi:DNA-binding beta-propeller fold protein YncE
MIRALPRWPAAVFALSGCSSGGPAERPFDCDTRGHICTWAGLPGEAAFGAEDVPATESGLYLPIDVAFAPSGEGYVLDWNNHRIRRVDGGEVRTVAGSGFLGDGPEGDALSAAFNHPTNLAFHPLDPNLVAISAWHNSRLELLDLAAGTLTFIAGNGDRNYNGGGRDALETELDLPSSVAWSTDGEDLYFTDQANQLLRRLGADGKVYDVGGVQRTPGYAGDGGPVADAEFHSSVGQAADPSNRIEIRGDLLYMIDSGNHVLRVVDLTTGIIDRIAGVPTSGYGGDGGPALEAQFSTPRDLALGLDGEIYIADTDNSCVRVIRADGIVDTFAGQCAEDGSTEAYAGDGGPATDALLDRPFGIAVDPDGNVYVADTFNHVIRRIVR